VVTGSQLEPSGRILSSLFYAAETQQCGAVWGGAVRQLQVPSGGEARHVGRSVARDVHGRRKSRLG